MIQRVNLIEAQPFTFTYLKLVKICAVVLFCASLFAGWQFAKVYLAAKNLATVREELLTMQNEEKRLQAKPVMQKVSVSQFPELYDRIIAAPKFSSILNEISVNLPTSVKLITLNTSVPVPKAGKPKAQAQKETGDTTLNKIQPEKVDYTLRKIEISGLSADAQTMTDFVSNLEKTKTFQNPVISESHKDGFGYEFRLISEAHANAR